MERKTKHRILGVFVVIGLVIILLPLFQGGKEGPTQAALEKAPPFPDQSVQVGANTTDQTQQPVIPIVQQANENPVNQQPDDTININRPSVINTTTPDVKTQAQVTPISDTTVATKSARTDLDPTKIPTTIDSKEKAAEISTAPNDEIKNVEVQMTNALSATEDGKEIKTTEAKSVLTSGVKQASVSSSATAKTKKLAHNVKSTRETKVAALAQAPIDNNGLIKLKNAAWVIQMGSFKNKANALRLVNQLRSNGYRAFIQQVSTFDGQNTRVFVGPESKQASARQMANQLETEMHLRGIVISYKPLAL